MENYILIYCFFWISDVQKMKINQTVLKEFILVGFSVYPHVQTSFLWFFFAPTFSPSQVTWPSWVLPGWTDISTHSCTSSLVHSPFLRPATHYYPQVKWSEVAQLCPTLSDPVDYSLPGSSVHGIFQARVLEWGVIAFSNGYPQDAGKSLGQEYKYFSYRLWLANMFLLGTWWH